MMAELGTGRLCPINTVSDVLQFLTIQIFFHFFHSHFDCISAWETMRLMTIDSAIRKVTILALKKLLQTVVRRPLLLLKTRTGHCGLIGH